MCGSPSLSDRYPAQKKEIYPGNFACGSRAKFHRQHGFCYRISDGAGNNADHAGRVRTDTFKMAERDYCILLDGRPRWFRLARIAQFTSENRDLLV